MPTPDRPPVTETLNAALAACRADGLRPEFEYLARRILASALPGIITAVGQDMKTTMTAAIEPVMADAIQDGIDQALATERAAVAKRFPVGDGTFTVRVHKAGMVLTCDRCGFGFVYHVDHSVWLHRLNEEAAHHTCPTDTEGTPA